MCFETEKCHLHVHQAHLERCAFPGSQQLFLWGRTNCAHCSFMFHFVSNRRVMLRLWYLKPGSHRARQEHCSPSAWAVGTHVCRPARLRRGCRLQARRTGVHQHSTVLSAVVTDPGIAPEVGADSGAQTYQVKADFNNMLPKLERHRSTQDWKGTEGLV